MYISHSKDSIEGAQSVQVKHHWLPQAEQVTSDGGSIKSSQTGQRGAGALHGVSGYQQGATSGQERVQRQMWGHRGFRRRGQQEAGGFACIHILTGSYVLKMDMRSH